LDGVAVSPLGGPNGTLDTSFDAADSVVPVTAFTVKKYVVPFTRPVFVYFGVVRFEATAVALSALLAVPR
jgi:hypothetical protein